MEVLTQYELRLRKKEIIRRIGAGEIFIHPSDTIYGLGCDAKNEKAVQQLRRLKGRFDKPLSVWVPSKDWIRAHCQVNEETAKWLEKLPGPYTLVLPVQDKKNVAAAVSPGNKTLGVRLPDHWFADIVQQFGRPIVTTSANFAGGAFMTSLENLEPGIKAGVSFIVYEGEKKGHPSQLVDLTKRKVEVKVR